MIQIIPENRRQSTGSRFAEAFGNILGSLGQQIPEELTRRESAEKLNKLTGQDISSLSPELQKTFLSEFMKQQGREKLQQNKFGFTNEILRGRQPSSQQGMQLRPRGILADEGMPSKKGVDTSKFSDEDILRLNAIDPNLGRAASHSKDVALREAREERSFAQRKKENLEKTERAKEKVKRDIFESDRTFNTQFSKPIIEDATKDLKNAVQRKSAINNMMYAIKNGDEVGILSPDWWADFTGINAYRSSTGAQLQNAAKEFLLSGVGRAGSRPNQWIEQRILSMTPEIGKTREANETYAEGLSLENDLNEAYAKEVLRLQQEDTEKYGFPKADIATRASQNIEPIVRKRQEIAKYRMQKIRDREKGIKSVEDLKTVAPGTPITLNVAMLLRDKFGKNAYEAAKRLGYEITDAEIMEEGEKE